MREAVRHFFEDNLERNSGSVDRALAETVQALALLGLSRTDFFTKAAFYGGTALRLLHGLDRFSEDLDFSLLKPEDNFKLNRYFPSLADELESFGFTVEITAKEKNSAINSAFIKTNTKIHVLKAGVPAAIADAIHRNAVCKVKFEIDTDPPPGATFEVVYLDDPMAFSVRSYSPPALFAGKMDAVLSRGWKDRVKGRDWYDFAYFVRKKTPLLLPHLEARLRQKGFFTDPGSLEATRFLVLLKDRIETVDFDIAKADVVPFIRDPRDVDVWSKEYFLHVMQNLQIINEPL